MYIDTSGYMFDYKLWFSLIGPRKTLPWELGVHGLTPREGQNKRSNWQCDYDETVRKLVREITNKR